MVPLCQQGVRDKTRSIWRLLVGTLGRLSVNRNIAANSERQCGAMSPLLVVVVGLSVMASVANNVDLQSRTAARQLLTLSLDVVQSLRALNVHLSNQSGECYVIEHVTVGDVTVDDVTETSESWIRQPITIALQLTKYHRRPSSSTNAPYSRLQQVYYTYIAQCTCVAGSNVLFNVFTARRVRHRVERWFCL